MTGRPWRPSIHGEVKAALDRRDEGLRARFGLASNLRVDRNGEPMSESDWTEASNDSEYVRVAQDAVGDVRISTVWIGTDDRVIGDGTEPQIFETMVIDHRRERERDQQDRRRTVAQSGNGIGDLQERYGTEEDALIGHRQIVAVVKARLAEAGGR